MNYAQNIKNLREDNDLYQKDIAKILGTTQSYYAQYENGKRPLPYVFPHHYYFIFLLCHCYTS